jgi:arginine decarboxylase
VACEGEIHIVWGSGEGKTEISAFDKALEKAGIHNFNLIQLSSVIPPETRIIERGRYRNSKSSVGDKIYVVLSTIISKQTGKEISAGLGWVQSKEGGIFFEYAGEFPVSICKETIEIGLNEMMSIRKWDWDDSIKLKVISHKVRKIGCCMIAAVYDHEGW